MSACTSTVAPTVQAAPVLIAPGNAAQFAGLAQPVALTVNFDRETRGRIEISKDSLFTSIVETHDVKGTGDVTVAATPLDPGDYFWRTFVTTTDGKLLLSAVRTFTIGRVATGAATLQLHVSPACTQFDRKDYAFPGTVSLTMTGVHFDATVDSAGVNLSADITRSTQGPMITMSGHAHQQFGLSSEHIYVQTSETSSVPVTLRGSASFGGQLSGSFEGFVRLVLGTVSAGGATCTAPNHSFTLGTSVP